MNFNRVETFVKDNLIFQAQELIQYDLQFNCPLHYFFDQDYEMDFVLSRIFKDSDAGCILPVSEHILHSMMLEFITRENPLSIYH